MSGSNKFTTKQAHESVLIVIEKSLGGSKGDDLQAERYKQLGERSPFARVIIQNVDHRPFSRRGAGFLATVGATCLV